MAFAVICLVLDDFGAVPGTFPVQIRHVKRPPRHVSVARLTECSFLIRQDDLDVALVQEIKLKLRKTS